MLEDPAIRNRFIQYFGKTCRTCFMKQGFKGFLRIIATVSTEYSSCMDRPRRSIPKLTDENTVHKGFNYILRRRICRKRFALFTLKRSNRDRTIMFYIPYNRSKEFHMRYFKIRASFFIAYYGKWILFYDLQRSSFWSLQIRKEVFRIWKSCNQVFKHCV